MVQHDLSACWDLCRRGEPVTALARGLEAWNAAKLVGDAASTAAAAALLGWFCLQLGEVEAGIDHAYAAKIYYEETADLRRSSWAVAVYAWLLFETGLTEEAVNEALKAVSQAEEDGDPATIAWALNVLAIVFWGCKQLDRAKILSERAVALARHLDDPVTLGWFILDLAGIHSDMAYARGAAGDAEGLAREIATALELNTKALRLAESQGDAWGQRIALANAAEYHLAVDAVAEAQSLLDRWEAIASPCGARTVAHFLYTKGQLRIRQGRLAEALSVCGNALALAQESRNTDSEAHALRLLSEIYEKLGRFDAALAYFKRFHEAQGRLSADKVQRRARVAEVHYETERFKRLADEASRRADELAVATRLDPLTGLGNRRSLDDAFDRLASTGGPYAVAVIDLDRFKGINDNFSHAVGDEVLRRVAALIREETGPGDLAARLGGEEFVWLFDGADLGQAMRRCAAFRRRLGLLGWADIHSELAVTASIGVAGHEEASEPPAVLALADARLYAAKAAGRDRIVGCLSDRRPPLSEGADGTRRSRLRAVGE